MSEYVYATIGGPVANALGEIFLPRCEIVRCRDCKRCVRYETWNSEGEAFNCNYWGSDTEPDGFCKWGERRES